MLQNGSFRVVGLRRMITGGLLVMFCCTVGAADRSHRDVAQVRQEREDQGGAQASPENRSLWGALAIDANQGQKWGWAIDFATVREAEQRALAECGGPGKGQHDLRLGEGQYERGSEEQSGERMPQSRWEILHCARMGLHAAMRE